MTIHATDVAIVGGGMVGGALALGLAQQGFTVTVLEKTAPPAFEPASAPDVRISAISAASVGLLKSLGVWDAVRAMRVHAYRRLETWEWESAHVAFDAAELKLPELGYMVENKVLQWGLWQALAAHEGVTLRVGSELEAMQRGEAHTALHLREGEAIHARLVIGADGANSQVREMAGIGVHAWQYQQSCMLISVECVDDPGDSTWQQFTPSGPRAFLPLFDHWASLVWYDTPARIRQLQGMTMAQLQQEIASHFPARLGRVTPQAAGAFRSPGVMHCSMSSPAWRWWAMRRIPFIRWRGRGLTLATAMWMPCWRSWRKRAAGRRLGQPAGAEALPGAAASG